MTSHKAEGLIEELLKLHPKGFDLSLTRISGLLEKLGNPQDKIPPVIHIAGTNGKGSASAFCRALLESGGYTCHVHTSPHLVHWNERYRIGQAGGGRLVDDATFADAISRVAAANNGQPITVFEILSAVAFVLFCEHPADATILEVGLGGRFDATNVIKKPAVSLIQPIALDHEAYLGNTVEKIAFEKAGIIKQGCPVVIGYQAYDSARDVLLDVAEKYHSQLQIYGQDYQSYEEHGRMVFQDETGLMDLPKPVLFGAHQFSNAAAAIAAVRMAGFHLHEEQIAHAMKTAFWPARMQHLKEGKLVEQAPQGAEIWLDGGHNPAAAEVISAALKTMQKRPLIMICGMINTKDSLGFFQPFKELEPTVFTVPITSSDASVPPELLAQSAKKAGLNVVPANSVAEVFKQISVSDPRILICGSLYLAGDVLQQNQTPPQ